MLLTPALRRQRQADLREFEASLGYRVSSRTAKATQRNPVSKKPKKNVKRISLTINTLHGLICCNLCPTPRTTERKIITAQIINSLLFLYLSEH